MLVMLQTMQAKFVTRVTIRSRETTQEVKGAWCTEEKLRTEMRYSKPLVIHIL